MTQLTVAEGRASKGGMSAVLRAAYGYLFLVFIVRVVGRRPGKQMTPFDFVLIFFIGGLMLTAMVGDEASFTNALLEIMTMAAMHFLLVWLRDRSSRFARVVDGTPLLLLQKDGAREDVLRNAGIAYEDLMASARDEGLKDLNAVDYAVLERNGEISTIPKEQP
jgi:uncharacterized membrane protein YcaP (DUF421 family)